MLCGVAICCAGCAKLKGPRRLAWLGAPGGHGLMETPAARGPRRLGALAAGASDSE